MEKRRKAAFFSGQMHLSRAISNALRNRSATPCWWCYARAEEPQ